MLSMTDKFIAYLKIRVTLINESKKEQREISLHSVIFIEHQNHILKKYFALLAFRP